MHGAARAIEASYQRSESERDARRPYARRDTASSVCAPRKASSDEPSRSGQGEGSAPWAAHGSVALCGRPSEEDRPGSGRLQRPSAPRCERERAYLSDLSCARRRASERAGTMGKRRPSRGGVRLKTSRKEFEQSPQCASTAFPPGETAPQSASRSTLLRDSWKVRATPRRTLAKNLNGPVHHYRIRQLCFVQCRIHEPRSFCPDL